MTHSFLDSFLILYKLVLIHAISTFSSKQYAFDNYENVTYINSGLA